MADQKISELVEKTIPVGADLLAIVDSEVTPNATKKALKSNIVKAFGRGWTADKLLKGAGAGVDPTEIDVSATDFPMKMKPAIVRWVVPGWKNITITTATVVADRIYYTPIFVSEATTYIRIGIEVTTAVAGTADLRIFNWNDGLPSSLILSAGTVDTGTTGTKEIVISQQLTRGYYFLAASYSGAPALRSAYSGMSPVSGLAEINTGGRIINCILIVDAVYADPAPAPTGATNETFSNVCLREN